MFFPILPVLVSLPSCRDGDRPIATWSFKTLLQNRSLDSIASSVKYPSIIDASGRAWVDT